MSKESAKNLQQWLIEANLDSTYKKATGWHIDDVEPALSKSRDLWYIKALDFFLQAQIIKQQLGIPWTLFLVFYLKDRRKYRGINFHDQQTFEQELSIHTPPEIFLFAGDYTNEYLMTLQGLSFLPQDLDVYFYEKFDVDSRSYRRAIYIFLKKQHILRLLTANLYSDNQILSFDQAKKYTLVI